MYYKHELPSKVQLVHVTRRLSMVFENTRALREICIAPKVKMNAMPQQQMPFILALQNRVSSRPTRQSSCRIEIHATEGALSFNSESLVPFAPLEREKVVGRHLAHIPQNCSRPPHCQPLCISLFALCFRGAAPNFPRFRTLKMLRGNPALIVTFCTTSRSSSGRVRTPRVDFLTLSA